MGIRFLWVEVRYHADMDCGLVGGYLLSVDSFDVFTTLNELSELSDGCFTPGGDVVSVKASGEEVVDTDPGRT